MTLRDILTPTELKRVALVAEGYSNAEIARAMGTTESGVKQRMNKLYEKCGVGRSQNGSLCEPRILLALRYDRETRGVE